MLHSDDNSWVSEIMNIKQRVVIWVFNMIGNGKTVNEWMSKEGSDFGLIFAGKTQAQVTFMPVPF